MMSYCALVFGYQIEIYKELCHLPMFACCYTCQTRIYFGDYTDCFMCVTMVVLIEGFHAIRA